MAHSKRVQMESMERVTYMNTMIKKKKTKKKSVLHFDCTIICDKLYDDSNQGCPLGMSNNALKLTVFSFLSFSLSVP